MNWARLGTDEQACFLVGKFLEVVVQQDAPRMRAHRRAFFYFRVQV